MHEFQLSPAVDCGPLPNPTNGQVSTTNDATIVGSVAMFTCNTGYTLSHQDMARCGEDGQWSPASPSCLSESVACETMLLLTCM